MVTSGFLSNCASQIYLQITCANCIVELHIYVYHYTAKSFIMKAFCKLRYLQFEITEKIYSKFCLQANML
jgi:hypothetical protein